MAITGISSALNGVALASGSGSSSGPKVQEANVGIFQQLLDKMQQTVGIDTNSVSSESSPEVGELRLQTTQFKTDFQRKLIQRLLERGVDLSQPFTLKGDGFGGVDVAGGHPDREIIEQLFEEDSELRSEFSQLAGQAERLFAADRTAIPTAAAPDNGLFDSTAGSDPPAFNLIVRDGQTEMAFLR